MFEFLRKKWFLTLKLWCWYYLSFDEINIEFCFIWELSAENLQTNPKIRWGLFWGLFKTQNRNIQLFSPVNQHSKCKKQKNEFNRHYYHYQWIPLTSSPLSDIVGKTRRQVSVLFFRLSVLFFFASEHARTVFFVFCY